MTVLENRSVPPDTILPHVEYQDLPAAIDWLTKTFGFVEHYRYGEPVSGAQLHIGNAWVMVKQASRHQQPCEARVWHAEPDRVRRRGRGTLPKNEGCRRQNR